MEDPRFNRSFEFDGLSDDLGRFILEEVLPAVEKHTTKDGRTIHFSTDPSDRAVGGASTGGIGAFTIAWEHPDEFRRVFSAIGTFVGMRGGDRYPVLIRKTEPKPIRIFLQDGSQDGLQGFLPDVGDWWMTNQAMERALAYAGYDVNHVWGEGMHDARQATSIFPDAMRWLWRDWPKPIEAGQSQNTFMRAILTPGEDWHEIPGEYQSIGSLASDPRGEVLFQNVLNGKLLQVAEDGTLSQYGAYEGTSSQIAFDKEGRIYVSREGNILAYGEDRKPVDIAKDIRVSQMIVTDRGMLYVTEPGIGDADGKVWLIHPSGEKLLLDSDLHQPTGIALSPDGLWLTVAEGSTHWGYSYQVKNDGTVTDKQRFYWFHVPDTADNSGARASVMDRDGRLYVATRMGVQVFDRNGRSRAILPLAGGEVTGLSFGGKNFDELYVSCSNKKVYRRKMNVVGAPAWLPPIQLPQWSPA